MYSIVETDELGDPWEDSDGTRLYLNHSCLSSMSFGSEDMAWTTESELEAEGMLSRVTDRRQSDRFAVIEIY